MRTAMLLLIGLALGCGAADEPAPASPEPTAAPEPTAEPAPEPNEANPHPDWYACTAASDCVLVPAVCGGSIGANATHAAEATAEQEALRIVSLCAAPTAPPPPVHPDCVSNVCVAVPDVLPTAES